VCDEAGIPEPIEGLEFAQKKLFLSGELVDGYPVRSVGGGWSPRVKGQAHCC
jgi:hypothetical protein